jgi:tRNA(Arg) A34 adenosine deaminase TadA
VAGDEPFGSVLVSADGRSLFEDRNRVKDGDNTRHPELAIALWTVENMEPAERAGATVYTSGEHCPMCAAAHAWVGLGRIVYAVSSSQLSTWLAEWNTPPSPVAGLSINTVAPQLPVDGPADELEDEMRALHAQRFGA